MKKKYLIKADIHNYGFFIKIFRIMRISAFLLFISILQVLASDSYSQVTRLTLSMSDATIQQVLVEIEAQSEFYILFNHQLVDVNRKVNIEVSNKKISNILTALFKDTDVEYLVMGRQIILSPKKILDEGVDKKQRAQEPIEVTGTITDSDGNPLPGVNIVIKGTIHGSISDANGNYDINVDDPNATLVFSFIGFTTLEIPVGNQTIINLTLVESAIGMEEVVVIGYGKQSRETLTTSISTVDTKVLENIPYANLGSALQGSAAGVVVQSLSGQPGAAPRIIIRGGTSINDLNSSNPLYIVDGVIRPDIDNINSLDIESIQVLKDAASTSIYGARASNSVVLVTTKTGKPGQMEIIYNYDLSLSRVGKTYDMASAHDYLYYGREALRAYARMYPSWTAQALGDLPYAWGTGNDLTKNTAYTTMFLTPENEHKLNEGWSSMTDPLDPSKTIIYKGTDWQDVLFRTGVSHNHHLSFRGGTDKVTVNGGFGQLNDEGIAIRTGFKRFTGNLNGKLLLRDNLTLFSNVMFSNSSDMQVYSVENIFYRSIGMAPTTKYAFEDGTLAPGVNTGTGNPAYHLENNKSENSHETLTLSLGGRWDILPGLSFNPQVSFYKAVSDGYSFTPSFLNGVNNMNTTRNADTRYSKFVTVQADAYFAYNKSFNAHHIDAMAGFSYYGRESFNFGADGNKAVTDIIPTLNAVSEMVNMTSTQSEQVIIGYFGRVNYDYMKKYLISANLRYDGASNLGLDNKWGYFPGVAIGWNLHNEEFWSGFPDSFNRLKIRGSYGITGNIGGLGDYQSQGSYSVGRSYIGESAIMNTVIANPGLKWEKSKTLNLGADIAVLNERVSMIFDVYRRVTDDLITSLVLPPSSGFTSIATNLGSLENKGIEMELMTQIIKPRNKSGFQWNVSIIAAKTKHKILSLPENGQENNRVGGFYLWDSSTGDYAWKGGFQEGGEIGDFYAWQSTGVYATDEEGANAPFDAMMSYPNKTKYGGDTDFLDADNNDTIDVRDMVYQGNPFPTWTGGLSSTMSYKGFELYIRTDFTTGHTIYNYGKIFMAGRWSASTNFPQEMVTDGWHEQGDVATLPQFSYVNSSLWRGSAYANTSTHSHFYELGNFLCLREITLSYNLPASILKAIKLKNMRLNISGYNLYYFTNYTGLNPEDGGVDRGRYPLPRKIIFGAIVSF